MVHKFNSNWFLVVGLQAYKSSSSRAFLAALFNSRISLALLALLSASLRHSTVRSKRPSSWELRLSKISIALWKNWPSSIYSTTLRLIAIFSPKWVPFGFIRRNSAICTGKPVSTVNLASLEISIGILKVNSWLPSTAKSIGRITSLRASVTSSPLYWL